MSDICNALMCAWNEMGLIQELCAVEFSFLDRFTSIGRLWKVDSYFFYFFNLCDLHCNYIVFHNFSNFSFVPWGFSLGFSLFLALSINFYWTTWCVCVCVYVSHKSNVPMSRNINIHKSGTIFPKPSNSNLAKIFTTNDFASSCC
jgi:hypothetical protein